MTGETGLGERATGETGLGERATGETGLGLGFLSYNVRGLRDDFAAVQRVITDSGARVVLLQEMPKVFRWRSRCAELARRCGLVVVTGGAPAAGNLLLCELGVRVHRTEDVLFPRTTGQQLRGAAVAELSLRGRRFVVVGTHLSLLAAERVTQARGLLDLISRYDSPAVLGGDLNEPPGGEVERILATALADTAVSALPNPGQPDPVGTDPGQPDPVGTDPGQPDPVFTDQNSTDQNSTDQNSTDQTPTFSTASARRRIDYLWADRRLPVSRYQVLDSPDARSGSDHFPVYAEFMLT